MNDPRVRSLQISPGVLEAAQLDELIREIQQKSLFYYQEKNKSLRARYVYGTIFLIINLCAWFIRDYAQKALALLPCMLSHKSSVINLMLNLNMLKSSMQMLVAADLKEVIVSIRLGYFV